MSRILFGSIFVSANALHSDVLLSKLSIEFLWGSGSTNRKTPVRDNKYQQYDMVVINCVWASLLQGTAQSKAFPQVRTYISQRNNICKSIFFKLGGGHSQV